MSRSDTFDSEPDCHGYMDGGARSMPWISAPILQNTTCDAFLDPCKLLCESSSFVALIPCQTFSMPSFYSSCTNRTPESAPGALETHTVHEDIQERQHHREDPADDEFSVFQSDDLLSEILSTTNAFEVMGSNSGEILTERSVSPVKVNESRESNPSDESLTVVKELPLDDLSWNIENDDGFRDVIEAINRLCDTMSNTNNATYSDDFSSLNAYQSEIVEQPSSDRDNQPFYVAPVSSNPVDFKHVAQETSSSRESIELKASDKNQTEDNLLNVCPENPLNHQTADTLVLNSDSFIASEDIVSSPAPSSTNAHADVMQCSGYSWTSANEELGGFLLGDSHLPKPEEIPPPGHVAAMRMKFETFNNFNINTMRLLKKSEDEV